MQYKELTPEEQAKVRRILRDRIPGRFGRVGKVVRGGDGTSVDDGELLAQLRALWAQHRDVLSADFTLPGTLTEIIERDRRDYLAPDDALGPLPDPKATDPARLVRRIHHQRLALRRLEALHAFAWRTRADDIRRARLWNEATQRTVIEDMAAESDADPVDMARLQAKVHRQRRALQRAHRLIDAQRAELGRLVDALVRAAATG